MEAFHETWALRGEERHQPDADSPSPTSAFHFSGLRLPLPDIKLPQWSVAAISQLSDQYSSKHPHSPLGSRAGGHCRCFFLTSKLASFRRRLRYSNRTNPSTVILPFLVCAEDHMLYLCAAFLQGFRYTFQELRSISVRIMTEDENPCGR